MSGDMILGRLRVEVFEIQGLEGYSAKDGVFTQVSFQQQDQRTVTNTGPYDTSRQWNATFDFDVTDTQNEGDNDIVVIVKENKANKKGAGKEEECGRVRISLEDLEAGKDAIERWFPLSKNQKPTPAILHMRISYSVNILSELISIFSEVTEEEVVKEKLSLSALQYNVVRVVLALLPLFRILRQFMDLTRWRNPAASAFALQLFVMVLVFDYLATAVCVLGSIHFGMKFLEYYKLGLANQGQEGEDGKSKSKKDQATAVNPQGPKTSIFEKIKKAQTIAGKIADRIEPLKDLWEWKDPEKSKIVMYLLLAGSFLFLFMDWTILLRYTLLVLVLYLFTLKTLYARYPRFRKKYHLSILLPIVKEKLKELLKLVTFFVRKRRSLFKFTNPVKVGDLQDCEIAGFLTKQGAVRKSWKRRYFVLGTKELYYFNSDDPKEEVVGWIDLTHCNVVDNPPSPPSAPPQPHLFELFDSEIPRHYLLVADSAEEKVEWLKVLHSIVKVNRQGYAGKGGSIPPPVPQRPATPHKESEEFEGWTKAERPVNPSLTIGSAGAPAPGSASVSTPNLGRHIAQETKKAKKKNLQDVTVQSLTDQTKAGWLQKQGDRRKAWKHRYFVLSGSSLYYFKKTGAKDLAIGFIPLTRCRVTDTTVSDKKHLYPGIDIYHTPSNRHYVLWARDETERKEWLEALKGAKGAAPRKGPVVEGLESLAADASDATQEGYETGSRSLVRSSSGKRQTMFIGDASELASLSPPAGAVYYEKIALGELSRPIRLGFLYRHESTKMTIRRNWKRRFIVIANSKLYIFNSNNEKELSLDSISLEYCLVSELPGYTRNRPFCFEVSQLQPAKQVLLSADTESERSKWLSVIRQVTESDLGGKGSEGDSPFSSLPSLVSHLHRLAIQGENDEVDRILWEYWLKENGEKDKDKEKEKEKEKEQDEVAAKPQEGVTADISSAQPSEGNNSDESKNEAEKEKERETEKEKPKEKEKGKENGADKITYGALIAGTERKNGQTLLHTSAEYGNLELVRVLVEKYKADINAYDRLAWTPLHTAAHCNHLAIYDYLLRNAADTKAMSMDEATPLHYLVRCESKKNTRVLEDSFAKLKGQTGDNEEYLLLLIEETLNRGGDINAANNRGETCLHNAVKRGNFKVTKFLLERGADVTHRNTLGASCVDVAQREGNEELMALLRAYEIVAREGVADPSKRRPSVPSGPKPQLRKMTHATLHESPEVLLDDPKSLKKSLGSLELAEGADLLNDCVHQEVEEFEGVDEDDDRDSDESDEEDGGEGKDVPEPSEQVGGDTQEKVVSEQPKESKEEEGQQQDHEPAEQDKASLHPDNFMKTTTSSELSLPFLMEEDAKRRLARENIEATLAPHEGGKNWHDKVIGNLDNILSDDSPPSRSQSFGEGGLIVVEKEGGPAAGQESGEKEPTQQKPSEEERQGRRISTFLRAGVDSPSPVGDRDSVSLFSIGAARSLPREATLDEIPAPVFNDSPADYYDLPEELEVINKDKVTLGQLVVGAPAVTGFLKLRQGTVRKVWKRFYFALRGNEFFFFPTASSRDKPAGNFSLARCSVEEALEEIKGEKYCFVLTNLDTKKSFAFAAETKEERDRWVDELLGRQATRLGGRGRTTHHSAVF